MSSLPVQEVPSRVEFETQPSHYRHWSLQINGSIATLYLDVAEQGGLRPGYSLKLNSYDLGVDIELNDALNRIRFEHPQVGAVVITSRKERVFCSGANIFMLASSSHNWKVNFCKFTNETRNGMEDSSRHSGLRFLAAVNGACAGGGYELALACDEIYLVDDRSSSVSLPEVPLLGVLPGTGGLTRLTDKRKVRHDLADIFCTTAEGIRGDKAKAWGLVDAVVKTSGFAAAVNERAAVLAAGHAKAANAIGVPLPALGRRTDASGLHYEYVDVTIDRAQRTATFTVHGPSAPVPATAQDIEKAGAHWWPLQMARELDDAILQMRSNEMTIGLWLLRTRGDATLVQDVDTSLVTHGTHWLVRETVGLLRRTLSRLDVSARSLFALVEADSCFCGTLLELALAADRSYMLSDPAGPHQAALTLTAVNFALYPMCTDQTRLERRFYADRTALDRLHDEIGSVLHAEAAMTFGLITSAPDELDWDDEVRIAIEERVALSPDALTGLEANLRFNGTENMASRIFGRLSAWQNWIFIRPSASGEKGALKLYGKGEKAQFDWNRV